MQQEKLSNLFVDGEIMARINIDPNQARAITSEMRLSRQRMEQEILRINKVVGSQLGDAWRDSSTDYFLDRFNDWSRKYIDLLSKLDEMTVELDKRIAELEQYMDMGN